MKSVSYQYSKLDQFDLSSLSGSQHALQASSPSVKNRMPGGVWLRSLSQAIIIMAASAASIFTPTALAGETNSLVWKYTVSAALKETYDNNVYLQSETPLADQASFVTTVVPQFGLTWQPGPALNGSLSYVPEITRFHSDSAENYLAQRVNLALAGKLEDTRFESRASLLFIDGSSTGPTWTGPGGAPATGGIPVRDRRDAAVYRFGLQVTHGLGVWFLRPAGSFYLHDFQTDHKATPGYQNYVDRSELTGGLDAGRWWNKKISASLGYRYGMQDQAKLLAFPEEYDNTFHRVLLGAEGEVFSWCKIAVTLGPEFRHYGDKVPPTFGDRSRTLFYVDATATLTPTAADTVSLSVKRFEQPGFSGRSAYDDLTYDLNWKHKLSRAWVIGLGGRAYNTDFLAPVNRNDWVLSGNTFVNYTLDAHWNLEMSYSYEDGLTRTANASGREYERHLLSVGIKYIFK